MKSRRLNNVKEELKENKSALIAIGFLIIIVSISIFAFIIPINPDITDTSNMLQGPSLKHI